MSKTSDLIKDALNLIKTKGWTQGAFARDADGASVTYSNPAAICYCMDGALMAVREKSSLYSRYDYWHAFDQFQKLVPAQYGPFISWQDTPGRTKEEVIELMERAAALAV